MSESTLTAPQVDRMGSPSRVPLIVHFTVTTIALILLANVVVTSIRMRSLLRDGPVGETSGWETPEIYNVWKAVHGYPIYELPNQDPYNVATYNIGMYRTYAALIRALHIDDAAILTRGRMITVIFALIGFIAQVMMIRAITPKWTRRDAFVVIAMGLITWFGGSLVSWWLVTIRPDIPAAAMTACALALLLPRVRNARWPRLILASLLFTAAWSFKQSFVWGLAGTCLYYLAFERDVRRTVLLAIPFAVIAGVTVALMGPQYRANTIELQKVFGLNLHDGISRLMVAAVLIPWFWAFPAIVLLLRRGTVAWNGGAKDPTERSAAAKLLLVTTAVTLAFSFIAISRVGAARYYLLESSVPAAALASAAIVGLSRSSERSDRISLWGGLMFLLPMLIFPAAQLAHVRGTGNIQLLDADESNARHALVQFIEPLPKPLFTHRPIVSLPWYATNDTYPAYPLNECYIPFAQIHGRIKTNPPSERIEARWFGSLLLEENDPLYPIALKAGYEPSSQAVPGGAERLLVRGAAPTESH